MIVTWRRFSWSGVGLSSSRRRGRRCCWPPTWATCTRRPSTAAWSPCWSGGCSHRPRPRSGARPRRLTTPMPRPEITGDILYHLSNVHCLVSVNEALQHYLILFQHFPFNSNKCAPHTVETCMSSDRSHATLTPPISARVSQ